MIKKILLTGLIIIPLILNACGASLTGGSTGVGNPPVDGGDDNGNTTTETQLFESGPVDIPAPIAKLEAPNPAKIILSVNQNTTSMTGLAGAIPNTQATPYVYVLDISTNNVEIVAAQEDGSFDTTTFASTGPFVVAGAVDNTASELGTPIILRIDDQTYIWLLTNGETITSGALTMNNDIVYLVGQSTTASSLKKSTNNQESIIQSTIYTVGVAGTADILASCDCEVDELFVEDGGIIIRSGTSFYVYNATETSFDLFFTLAEDEIYQETRPNTFHLEGPEGYPPFYAAIITNKRLYVVDATHALDYLITPLADNESILYFSWGAAQTFYFNLVTTNEDGENEMSLYNFNVERDMSPDWETLWDTKEFMSHPIQPVVAAASEGDTWITLSTSYYQTGEVLELGSDKAVNLQGLTSTTLNDFDSENNPDPSSGITPGDPIQVWQITSNHQDFEDGGVYNLNTTITGQYGGPDPLNNLTLLNVSLSRVVYSIELHSTGRYAIFCAEDENAHGQLYAFFAEDRDIVALTEGTAHCHQYKNWKIDSDTGHIVFTNNATDNESTQIKFIDPATDPRFL